MMFSQQIASSGPLRIGSSGSVVTSLQGLLIARGYSVTVDGAFGSNTQVAVRAFQHAHGIVEDGVVGLQTADALEAVSSAAVDRPVRPEKNLPANAPRWLAAAWKEIGVREVPPNKGPAIRRYIALAHVGAEGEPWCAIFANAMLESVGVRGTRSASSQSFRHDHDFLKLPGPAIGALAVFWRRSPESGLGHVGFYCGERAGHVWTAGGNESDQVMVEMMFASAPSFGLVGYWWPRSEPMPQIGPVIVDAAIPDRLTSVV